MESAEIRKRFLEFFRKRWHTIVPSSSLIPDDPSVLLTTAGMQQFKPYFVGRADSVKDFGVPRAASIQKCFRTSDIGEVGDATHLTFFEMLGHFSFGDYFKKETIQWTYELLTNIFGIQAGRIKATVFAGDGAVPFDGESFDAWLKLLPRERISKGPRSDNFWGPAGGEGPCGAANEVYVDDMEVATLVFMEYHCASDGTLTLLPKKGVDVGWGFERLAMKLQGAPTIFETDLFKPLFNLLAADFSIKAKRIISDHLRGSVFLIADGVQPSNKDKGYILRRILRRAISHVASKEKIVSSPLGHHTPPELSERVAKVVKSITDAVIKEYGYWYKELDGKNQLVDTIVRHEVGKSLDLLKSSSELRKVIEFYRGSGDKKIPGPAAFNIFSTFGITIDYTRDEAEKNGLKVDEVSFEEEFKKHQEISRAGAEKKFGGHGLLLNTGELKAGSEEELKKVLRLHTVTHLLQQALREVLGKEVEQRGSDITAERTRFDFSFPRKVTTEEINKVEELVNRKIKEDLPVNFVEMPKAEAEKVEALYFFREKYPEKVKVYYVGKDLKSAWSKEFCGGPHVKHTGEVGRFRIAKEEAVGVGVRRIRGIVE